MSEDQRKKIFDQLRTSPQRFRKKEYEFLGVKVELRSISLESAEKMGAFSENGKTSDPDKIWLAALEAVYVPGTDTHLFADVAEEKAEFRKFPIDEINKLATEILDVSGLRKEAQAEVGKS